MEVGSWKLGVGSWEVEVGSWKLGVGSWELEVGSWKLAVVFLGQLIAQPACVSLNKPVKRALITFLIAGVVIAALLMLAQDQETLTIKSDVSAQDARHSAYLAALVGSDLSTGNTFTVHTNGDQFFP